LFDAYFFYSSLGKLKILAAGIAAESPRWNAQGPERIGALQRIARCLPDLRIFNPFSPTLWCVVENFGLKISFSGRQPPTFTYFALIKTSAWVTVFSHFLAFF
jgi:hypothetical protein